MTNDNQQPTANAQQPTNQQPTTNSQQPTTNQPTTHNQQPKANNPPLHNNNNQQPTTNSQQTTTHKRQMTKRQGLPSLSAGELALKRQGELAAPGRRGREALQGLRVSEYL